MSMYKQKGFNRLTKLITIITFCVMYATLCFMSRLPREDDFFIIFPIISVLCSCGVFILTRLVYWVIDGFQDSEDQTS